MRRLSDAEIVNLFYSFSRCYLSQKNFEHNKTDLNIFFCNFILFAREHKYNIKEYFDFEFYSKSRAEQLTFLRYSYIEEMHILFNDKNALRLLDNKSITNRIFAEYLHRDWLDMTRARFDEFKIFVERHPKFFVKLIGGLQGREAKVLSTDQNSDLEELFMAFRRDRVIIEEIIVQHKSLAEFCPDVINTIRVNTLLDKHGAAHILTTSGRFGRVGGFVDNFHGGGSAVVIDPLTGVIVSDAINAAHERIDRHPDTGKIFCGFQYPCWKDVCVTVIEMAKRVPAMKLIGWDISINDKNQVVLVEANARPSPDVQQSPDSVGKLHLYKPLVDDWEQYTREYLKCVGYRVNDFGQFSSPYQSSSKKRSERAQFAINYLVEDCRSLLDVGCRKDILVKKFCPPNVKYYAVDYYKYDDATIECDFDAGVFPDIKVDTCLLISTAEYVEMLAEFLDNVCRTARRQVLIICHPIDKERNKYYRWNNPFWVDFTEDFLIGSITKNGFYLHQLKALPDNLSVILYDFRREQF